MNLGRGQLLAEIVGASSEPLPTAVAETLREFDIVVHHAGRAARRPDLVLLSIDRGGASQVVTQAVAAAGGAPVLALAPTTSDAHDALRLGARAVYTLGTPVSQLRGLLFALVGPKRRTVLA